MGRMYIYLLEMTDEGRDCAPAYEVNASMVVRAVNAKHARVLASVRAFDEGPGTWLSSWFSTCRCIGEVTGAANRKPGVICQDSNAS